MIDYSLYNYSDEEGYTLKAKQPLNGMRPRKFTQEDAQIMQELKDKYENKREAEK